MLRIFYQFSLSNTVTLTSIRYDHCLGHNWEDKTCGSSPIEIVNKEFITANAKITFFLLVYKSLMSVFDKLLPRNHYKLVSDGEVGTDGVSMQYPWFER